LLADSVEKVQFRERPKFCIGAGAFIPIDVGDRITNAISNGRLPQALHRDALTKIGFDGRPARFCRHLIFEVFNTIGTKRT
jgi:hypothetical protein